MKIAFLHEHPTWTQATAAAIQARGVGIETIDVATFQWRADESPPAFERWVNRVNSMPSVGRSAAVVAATGQLLSWLELHGQTVINGSNAQRIGSSKALQGALFSQTGMHTPATVAIGDSTAAIRAAEAVGFPVLTKPNVGGSGAGISRFDHREDLATAVASGEIDLGSDGTGVVQQVIESFDDLVYRVEMLGADVLYATAQPLSTDGFNYCAVDGTAAEDSGSRVRLIDPGEHVVRLAAAFMTSAQADVGSVEFIIDAANGRACFFDFNPYSNYIVGFDDELGFNPIERYVDFILGECV
jgi:hypothetical protein